MASKKYIAECLLAIKTVYPYFAKDVDEKALAKIWYAILGDFPDELISESLKNCLQSLTVPPTPADIVKKAHELYAPSVFERFALLMKKLRAVEREEQCFNFTFVEENGKTQGENARAAVARIWETMPFDLKYYLGSQGEMLRISRDLSDEAMTYERNRFIKYFENKSPTSATLIEAFNEKKALVRKEIKELQ